MFVICIGIICRYFVGHGSCIYTLCETWNLKIRKEYVWVFCKEYVCKIWKCEIDDMKVKYSK